MSGGRRGETITARAGEAGKKVECVHGSSRANVGNRSQTSQPPGTKKDRRANVDPLPKRLMLSFEESAGRF